jgi:hypothetical protein
MGPFAALERFFERLFERPTARLFRTRLQPLQLQRRIERAIENGRLSSADRVFVPNRFIVRLNPADVDAFGELVPDLEQELAASALNYSRSHRYTLADRPDVRLQADPSVRSAEVVVQARFVDDDGVRDAGSSSGGRAGTFGFGGGRGTGQPLAPDLAFPALTPEQMTRTMVFQVPYAEAPVAILREYGPDGAQREITLDGRPMTVGRSIDNAIVVRDSRVSRHHGRLQGRQGALVYSDLGSTNGSRVNGVAVDEVVLGEGDRIEIGDTVLVVESLPDA